MNTQDIRRKAEQLRAEQSPEIIRGLARWAARFYARLATRGGEINIPARSSRGLF